MSSKESVRLIQSSLIGFFMADDPPVLLSAQIYPYSPAMASVAQLRYRAPVFQAGS
jgi:hypothetical protein